MDIFQEILSLTQCVVIIWHSLRERKSNLLNRSSIFWHVKPLSEILGPLTYHDALTDRKLITCGPFGSDFYLTLLLTVGLSIVRELVIYSVKTTYFQI